MKRQTDLAVVVVVFFVTSVWASPQPSDANNLITLQDYLRYASLNNAELQAEFENWKAAVEQVPQAKALPDPRFNYGYFIEEVETRVGPQRQKFEIMQSFPWFGVIEARTDVAAAKAKAAHKKYLAKKLETFQKVKHAFYEYAYLAKAIEITQQNLELITHFEEVARSRYTTAMTSHPDIIRAQIELAVLEDRLKSLEELRPAIATKLNSILNQPVSTNLPWPEVPQYTQVSFDFEQLYQMIIQNNPDLQAMGYEIEAARNNERLAKKKSFPNFGLGVSYIDTAHAAASGVSDSGKDPVMAMVSLTLPIWTDSYKAARSQARAQLRKKTHEKNQMQNSLAADAQQLLYDFEDSDRKIKLFRDVIIPKAEEMLTASESAYQTGTVDFLSLIDAQRMLLKYQLDYERYLAENAQNLAKIEMLTATELPIVESESDTSQK